MKNTVWKACASILLVVSLIVGVLSAAAGIIMEAGRVYKDGGILFKEQIASALFYEEIGTAWDYAFRLTDGSITETRRESYEARLSRENTNLAIEIVTESGLDVIVKNYPTKEYLYKFESWHGYNGATMVLKAYLQKDLSADDSFATALSLADFLIGMRGAILYIVIISAVLLIASLVFLLCAAGHRRGKEGIYIGWFSRIPLEIVAGLYFFLFAITVQILEEYRYYGIAEAVAVIILAIVWCLLLFAALITLAVRIKSRTLLRNTLTWRLLHLTKRLLVRLPLFWKTALVFAVFCVLEFFFLAVGQEEGIAFWLLTRPPVAAGLIYAVLMMRRLERAGQELAAGNTAYKVDTQYMLSDFKHHGENLNNLSIGLNRAVEERMKSERMKAELITNVSHDIKTPLTSIVNYVDLLSTGGLDSPDAPQYLEVLRQQSARLKKLTEDLIEASKASAGCIAVHAEPTNVNVFLSQVLGEYAESLRECGVEGILRLCPEEPAIFADGRLLWRVFDNLFSNVRKYAQSGTRTYLSSELREGCVVITLSNVSAEPLSVSGEELSERFVRGDVSRHTEGSGLGLSIARSLTELQGGTFGITVDGDLFKVTVIFAAL